MGPPLAVDIDGAVKRDVTLRRGAVSVHFNATDPYYAPPRPVGAWPPSPSE